MGICRNQSLVIAIPENESDTDSSTSPISEMKQLTLKKEPDVIKSHYTHQQIRDIYYSELQKIKFH